MEKEWVKMGQRQKAHRRGDYLAVNVGVSHDLGSQQPINRDQNRRKFYTRSMERLLQSQDVQRMAGFADSKFFKFCSSIDQELTWGLFFLRGFFYVVPRNS